MRKQVSPFGMESNWSVNQIIEGKKRHNAINIVCMNHYIDRIERNINFVKQNLPNELRKSVIRLILVVMTSMYSRLAQS